MRTLRLGLLLTMVSTLLVGVAPRAEATAPVTCTLPGFGQARCRFKCPKTGLIRVRVANMTGDTQVNGTARCAPPGATPAATVNATSCCTFGGERTEPSPGFYDPPLTDENCYTNVVPNQTLIVSCTPVEGEAPRKGKGSFFGEVVFNPGIPPAPSSTNLGFSASTTAGVLATAHLGSTEQSTDVFAMWITGSSDSPESCALGEGSATITVATLSTPLWLTGSGHYTRTPTAMAFEFLSTDETPITITMTLAPGASAPCATSTTTAHMAGTITIGV